jgi:hypothetical protein
VLGIRASTIPRIDSASSVMMSVTSEVDGDDALEIVRSATRPASTEAVTPNVLAAATDQVVIVISLPRFVSTVLIWYSASTMYASPGLYGGASVPVTTSMSSS